MGSIEMKNLRSFPMEKLCFDLKLEMLEQMDPGDVLELAKLNQGFQGMLVRRPSIVFGEHVYRIQFDDTKIYLEKFSNSNEMKLNVDHPFHFSIVKKIRSCDHLSFWKPHQFNEKYTLLKNLKLVNGLHLTWDSKEDLEKFFSNFHATIKKELDIYCSAFDDQVIKDRIENLMAGPQLKHCERIWFDCDSEDSFRFYYNALLRTQIKHVLVDDVHGGSIDLIVQHIVTNRIPSKNPEAAISIHSHGLTMDLSQYPGVRRIGGKNCRVRKNCRLLKQANYLMKNFGWSRSGGPGFFMEKSSMFRQRIDSTKDCIFVYDKGYTVDGKRVCCFLAFYVPFD